MINRILFILMLAGFCIAVPVRAHHSAAQFDFQNIVAMEGIIKEVKMANPHMKLVLQVNDDKGARDIVYEGHSRNNLYRRGWRPGMIKAGDRISITFAARRDGKDGGYVASVKTSDGKEF